VDFGRGTPHIHNNEISLYFRKQSSRSIDLARLCEHIAMAVATNTFLSLCGHTTHRSDVSLSYLGPHAATDPSTCRSRSGRHAPYHSAGTNDHGPPDNRPLL